jgi:transposase InsO family protein
VKGQGSITLESDVGGITHGLDMKRVLYVPDFKYKVFSTSEATNRGWRFINTRKVITATLNKNVNFLAERSKNGFYCVNFEVKNDNRTSRQQAWVSKMNNLYENFKNGKTDIVQGERTQQSAKTCITSMDLERLNLWHRRLGHANYEKIKEMQQKEIVKGLGSNNFKINEKVDCECCELMKATRIKFDKGPRMKAEGLLDLVHTDVCGPIHEQALGGTLYIITFIDDASRISEVYTVRNKSEVFNVFKEYRVRVEKETGRQIKVLRSDNGGEYINNEFEEYLRNNGIKHEKTTVYTPQQNGVAERLNRTLLEMTRCLLRERGVPNLFWPEAVKTANVIRNRITTKICGDKTPYELWTGRKPNIAHFRVFGCKAYVRIPRPHWGGKLSARADQGIFLGYDDRRKASLIWIQEQKRMVHSRDVVFAEDKRGWEDIPEDDQQEKSASIKIFIEEDKDKISNNETTETANTTQMTEQGNISSEGASFIEDNISNEEHLSGEEEMQNERDEQPTSRYDLRERTSRIRPEKYTMVVERPKEKKRRASTLEELTAKVGHRWNDDR